MLASLRATAVIAHNMLDRLAIRRPHARNADHFLTRSRRLAAASHSALPNGYIALLADPPFIVDGRSRLVPSRRQAKMRSNRSRPRKAPGIIDTDFEREGRNGTDAGNRHQTPTDRIMLDHLQEHAM